MTDNEFERLATLYGFFRSRPLREMLEAAVRAEREACAKVCDEKWIYTASPSEMADAIRARGEE